VSATIEQEPLTERTLGGLEVVPVAAAVEYIKLLVYGNAGVGKTVLAGSASEIEEMSPVLFLDIEGGTLSISKRFPDVDVVRLSSWKNMQEVYNALYEGEGGYKTVVLDSLTEIQKFSMDQIMAELIKDNPDRDRDIPSMREWGKNIEQIRRLVRGFRDLDYNVIFTALAVHDKDDRTGLWRTRPSLSGKLSGEVAGFIDIVGYMYTKVLKDQGLTRLLMTEGTDTQIAKDRTGDLEPVIQGPTMKHIHDAITAS
jgi:phage nucleotide-binding protein